MTICILGALAMNAWQYITIDNPRSLITNSRAVFYNKSDQIPQQDRAYNSDTDADSNSNDYPDATANIVRCEHPANFMSPVFTRLRGHSPATFEIGHALSLYHIPSEFVTVPSLNVRYRLNG